MSRLLYLHGSQAGPHGDKTDYLERHRHEVVGPSTPAVPASPTQLVELAGCLF